MTFQLKYEDKESDFFFMKQHIFWDILCIFSLVKINKKRILISYE